MDPMELCPITKPGTYILAYRCAECALINSDTLTIYVDAPTTAADQRVWQEYLSCCSSPTLTQCLQTHSSDILAKFPTSTYAGYALVKLGPACTMWAVAQQTPEQRNIELGIPAGAPHEAQERYRATQRAGREEFIKKATRFLAIHPDFAQADLLRKELATALFLLDRPEEALAEVRQIKVTEGLIADEAKRTLEEAEKRATPNPKK
jgi:hypothetical protein